jgi:hypothetical protein
MKVDASGAGIEAFESRAFPGADRGDVGGRHTSVEGQEAGDMTNASAIDIDQDGQV